MGQLAGIYWFDRRPIDVSTRTEALSAFQNGCAVEGPGLLVAWEDCTGVTDGALSSANVCVLDGSIHNFKEAAASVALDRGATPGVLALRLYEHNGPAALGKLIGDWSVAIWDARQRTVVLASDYAGTRPLYYFRSDECFAWSSSLDRLAQWMNCRHLDCAYVAEFLRTGFPRHLTPYRGIFPVPAGSAVSASPRRTAVTGIWSLPVKHSIQYHREGAYEEHFRAVFREAVAVRLQTGAPVASELSGGLDSSSIVCMADRLIASAAVPTPRIVTFSYLASHSPDLGYIGIAEQACSAILPVHLDAASFPVLTPQSPGCALPSWDESRQVEVHRRMQAMGLSVLLTGRLGDLITGNTLDDSDQAADYFWRGQIGAGVKEAFAWSRSQSIPVYPILWRALRTAAARPFARGLEKAIPSRRNRLRSLSELLSSRFFQCPQPLSGVLYSHPFTHRPLVEFMLAIPSAVMCRPGEPRRLMRRALRGIVPGAILRRGSKGNYEGLFLQSLRDCSTWLLNSGRELVLAGTKQTGRQEVVSGLRELSQGLPCRDMRIQQAIRLELWLRQRIECGAISVDEAEVTEFGDRGIPGSGIVRNRQPQ